MICFKVLTLFPEFFESPLKTSLLNRAKENNLVSFEFIPLKNFGEGKYNSVDDKPYGGGPGMVLLPTVFEKAFESLSLPNAQPNAHVVYLTPQGETLNAKHARLLSKHSQIVLLCGHYEGVDERVVEEYVDEEISIGDYVLTGGEAAALVLMDAVCRFVPGIVGEPQSVESDTFENEKSLFPGGLKSPIYTRPRVWKNREVPSVLLSGNHEEIAKWRAEQSEFRTKLRRLDLYSKKC